jgi:integration host factor subunit alpha
MSLTKAHIIDRVFEEVDGLSKKEAVDQVELVFKIMKDTLASGEKIKISGFGNFIIRDKSTRKGRNPQTGESMEISARRVLTFRPSQVLKEDVTTRYAHRIDDEGNENSSLPPKEGTGRALSSFMSNIEDPEDDNEFDSYFSDDE